MFPTSLRVSGVVSIATDALTPSLSVKLVSPAEYVLPI